MKLSTINDWLNWLNRDQYRTMSLGLDRVSSVALRLGVNKMDCPIIIVGGTNGKGSTVALLTSIFLAAKYQVGSFTSPYLFKLNEEIKINNVMITDDALLVALQAAGEAMQEIMLTPFEVMTLAALYHFKKTKLDVVILEVGLGGRLDAVNIMTPALSIVTSIGIDHVAWLGESREKIAFEKAHIFRANTPAICGDNDPPLSLINYANLIGAQLVCQGRDFHFKKNHDSWVFWSAEERYEELPLNDLALPNLSTTLMAVHLLKKQLPVEIKAIKQGLINAHLPARIQIINEPVIKIFDVAHNPHAIILLKEKILSLQLNGSLIAVFSMLDDKDIEECILILKDTVTHWFVAPLQTKRSASKMKLQKTLRACEIKNIKLCNDIKTAYKEALAFAKNKDCLLIFGSFYVISEVVCEFNIQLP